MKQREMSSESIAGKKINQRGQWDALSNETNTVLTSFFWKQKQTIFQPLKDPIFSFGITHIYTDDSRTDKGYLIANKHEVYPSPLKLHACLQSHSQSMLRGFTRLPQARIFNYFWYR